MSDPIDIVARLSGMSADHGPDGWPAVQMRDITALCEEVTRLRAELAEAQKLARDDFDLRAEQRDERDELRAALAQAGAGKEPRELDRHGWVRPRADGAKARCGGPAICKHCQGEQLLIAAHPSPAQREPLSDAQVLACARSVGVPAPMGLTRDRGPYEVTEPTWFLTELVRAIERAHGITTSGTQEQR